MWISIFSSVLLFIALSFLWFLFLLKFSFLVSCCILVLLVLGHQVVHVGFGLGEFHLVHTLSSVPMEESLTTEHSGELLRDTLEQFLDGSAVADECGRHLETTWWDVADSSFNIVGDPFNEVTAVLVLHVQHLLVDFLHGHASPEDGSYGEVSAVTRVAGSHHVLGIEHLLSQLGYRKGPVLLATSRRQGSEPRHEEMQTREWNHVDGQFAEICVKLSRESQTCGDTGHCGRD